MNVTGQTMDQTLIKIYFDVIEPLVPSFIKSAEYEPWIFSLLGSALIGLAGILPLVIIPVNTAVGNKDGLPDSDRKYCLRKFWFILYLTK